MDIPIGAKPIRKLRVQQKDEPWSEALEGQVQLPDEPLVDERRRTLAALAKLSPQYQRILEMMYIDHLSPQEIQAALGGTDGALQITKLLKTLREALKELLP